MYAIRQTIENPSVILEKETYDNKEENFKPVHLYGRSFVNNINSEKIVESLIIYKEGNNIAVSLHPDGIDRFVEQIKTTNDIIYLDDEVGRVIGELSETKGDNVVKENENFLSRIRQVTYSSLGQMSYPLVNKNYDRNNLLSTQEFIASKKIETGYLEITKELADPVMIFKSRTREDSFVFFTEQKDENNKIVRIPLAVDKRKGRIIVNEVTSMYGRNNEIDFVRLNIDEDKLVYIDNKRTNNWLKQHAENEKSLGGDRAFKVQFLEQRVTDIETYNPSILTKDKLVKFLDSGISTSVQKKGIIANY